MHDDASTDGTAAIILEYAEKYPDIILPIIENENQYSKGENALDRITWDAVESTGAKYIALCEGDDYWTDSLKLQKQVDFLEHHEDYGVVHTNAYEVHHDNDFKKISRTRNVPEGEVYKSLLKGNFIYTLSVLARKSLFEKMKNEIYPLPCYDRMLWLCFSRYTKFHYMPECAGAYRIIPSSATHGDYGHMLQFNLRTADLIVRFLKNTNASKDEINLFLAGRNHNIIKYSYLSGNKEELNKALKLNKELNNFTLADYFIYICSKLRVPGSLIKNCIQIEKVLRKKLSVTH